MTTPVSYDRLTLLRTSGRLILIRFVSKPGDGSGQISYEWIEFPASKIGEVADVTDWKDVFDRTPEGKRGVDSASEDEDGNGGIIVIDGLAFRWSRGGPEFGWLYLSDTNFPGSGMRPVPFDIYREQLETVAELNSLRDWLWKPIALKLE